jgi:hypothetical protein
MPRETIPCWDSRKEGCPCVDSLMTLTDSVGCTYRRKQAARRRPALRYNRVTSMIAGRIGCELALVAVFCVLTIFLFPAIQGPYSVVNGPVTSLQAIRAAARMRLLIIQAAFRSLCNYLISPLGVLFRMSFSQAGLHPLASPEFDTILRC